MSGHSKWAKIKHKKLGTDAKRGSLFTKVIKELTIAAKAGGNPDTNPSLRAAMVKAKEANMPSDNVERAIKRGTGELPGVVYETINYEGYGPNGVAIMVEVVTDNKNRASAEVRNIFSKKGGNLAGAGSVAWLFQKKGYFLVEKSKIAEEELMNLVIDAGAEDFKTEDENYEIITAPSDFYKVKEVIDKKGIKCEMSEITMLPSTTVKVTGADAKQVLNLVEALEDHDDVQNVYANFDIPEEDLEKE